MKNRNIFSIEDYVWLQLGIKQKQEICFTALIKGQFYCTARMDGKTILVILTQIHLRYLPPHIQ